MMQATKFVSKYDICHWWNDELKEQLFAKRMLESRKHVSVVAPGNPCAGDGAVLTDNVGTMVLPTDLHGRYAVNMVCKWKLEVSPDKVGCRLGFFTDKSQSSAHPETNLCRSTSQ